MEHLRHIKFNGNMYEYINKKMMALKFVNSLKPAKHIQEFWRNHERVKEMAMSKETIQQCMNDDRESDEADGGGRKEDEGMYLGMQTPAMKRRVKFESKRKRRLVYKKEVQKDAIASEDQDDEDIIEECICNDVEGSKEEIENDLSFRRKKMREETEERVRKEEEKAVSKQGNKMLEEIEE